MVFAIYHRMRAKGGSQAVTSLMRFPDLSLLSILSDSIALLHGYIYVCFSSAEHACTYSRSNNQTFYLLGEIEIIAIICDIPMQQSR